MRILFIRHGLTEGNLTKKYIGSTDQPLCSEGISELKKKSFERCSLLVCSPMKRCIQTADIIFPGQEKIICNDMKECDFGILEGKNHEELNGCEEYQEWIDSGGTGSFPGGESPALFKNRCIYAFMDIMKKYGSRSSLAFVVHGGTIMALMERFAFPKKDFYGWHIDNGCGYECGYDGESLAVWKKI